ncbi:MAG TPA: 2-oxoglutarate dehydrogenase complex dihydrolipoyllysine-residue succinyltransferase [Bacillales bacterium]|nr:2-oxoglutarate dehydrogenase complex dihydrolipoyllysine-residue succinyltransferase [Bacillales bacterium]
MIEVKVPELAESISEGTISQWLKQVGDKVERGEDIVELETDKVNVQISAENAGVLKEIKKEEGDDVEVGEVIAVLDENADAGSGSSESGDGESKEEKKEDNKEDKGTDKKAKKEEKAEESGEKEAESDSSSEESGDRPIATPAARKLARERGIDLSKVQARDPLGRVRAEDVKAHEEGGASEGKQEQAKKQSQPEAKQQDPQKPEERVKMSRRRRTIADRMLNVKNSTAMLTTFNEVDMTAVMNLRKRRKEQFQQDHDGVRLGFMSFFTKAVVGALKAYPLLNAEIDGNELVLKKYYDIGIAVASDEGLVVPVVRNADRLGFAGIEKEISDLAKKARSNSLSLNELQGGSFTITNGGVFGSLLSTPILNAPQVGILGMHTIQHRPVAVTPEKMEIRPMMYIALSYDHRIVDGSEAVSFLKKIKDMIEDPETLLLEG